MNELNLRFSVKLSVFEWVGDEWPFVMAEVKTTLEKSGKDDKKYTRSEWERFEIPNSTLRSSVHLMIFPI